MDRLHNFHIKDVNFVDVFKNKVYHTDVFVEDGKFLKSKNPAKHYRVIDGKGLYLLPAFIDLHTHSRGLEEKNKNTLEELQESALRGGYFHLVLMPNTKPPIDCVTNLRKLKEEARNIFIELDFSGCLTIGRMGEKPVSYQSLIKEGVKVFSDDGSCVQSAKVMHNICKTLSKTNAIIIEHPELEELTSGTYMSDSKISRIHNIPSSPAFNENIIVYRDLLIAKDTGVKMHFTHLSTYESVRIIKEFNKYYGTDIKFDVTPHHLLLSVEDIDKFDGTYNVKPFLKSREECKKLQEALIRNEITIIVTDHAPHSQQEKQQNYTKAPYGFIGLEFAFGLLFTHFVKSGKIGLIDLVKKFTIYPAKILNVDIKQSAYKYGNFALWDLNKSYILTPEKISSRAKNTPFLNYNIWGEVKFVFIKGELKYENIFN